MFNLVQKWGHVPRMEFHVGTRPSKRGLNLVDCLFCKIIEGKLQSEKIYEDSKVIAIKDITPQAPIHYLFMPRMHIENIDQLPEGSVVMADIFSAIQKVAKKEGFAQKGFRTSINTNKEGCQSVFHLHVHCLAGRQLGGNMVG